MESYSFQTTLPGDYDVVKARVIAALKEQGFGVLTEIDVKATLKTKLDVDFKRYAILGACNPPLAHRALGVDQQVGLMLPCNVIVYENDDGTSTVGRRQPNAIGVGTRSEIRNRTRALDPRKMLSTAAGSRSRGRACSRYPRSTKSPTASQASLAAATAATPISAHSVTAREAVPGTTA